jgi:hypothetical protein
MGPVLSVIVCPDLGTLIDLRLSFKHFGALS